MDDSFVGEIKVLPYAFVPANFLICQGQTLLISNYQVLYAVIGNIYGGDQQTSFKLPNLMNSVAIGVGQQANTTAHLLAQTGGAASVALTPDTMPSHTHTFNGATGGGKLRVGTPTNNTYLTNFGYKLTASDANFINATGYVPSGALSAPVTLNPNSISTVGGSAAHENRQPFINLCFCICFNGMYPSPA